MIKIRSLLKEDELDLDYNPFSVKLPQGSYIFFQYTDSGRDFGSHGYADIEIRNGDPKADAINTLKRHVLKFLLGTIDESGRLFDLDEMDVDELKENLVRQEYWFMAIYCDQGFWEVTGMEESLGTFHGPKSKFAGLLYKILKDESKNSDQVDLYGDELETYADDLMQIDAYIFGLVDEISIREGGFGEFVDYVLDGGDPERFDVGTILTEG
jgi:hypothetical protein